MINSVVFDLDGTLYLGEKVVEGAREAVSALERQGFRIFYFTNNSGKTRRQIVDKLDRLGFKADMWNTYCASYAVSAYLAKNKISPVYLIGADGLRSELASRGIKIEDSPAVSAVVIGLELLCKDHGLSPKEICVVGDVPESDIAMADNFRCQSIFFDPKGVFPWFSGKRSEEHTSELQSQFHL